MNLLPSTSPSTISLLPSILFFPISWVLFCGVIFTKSWEVFRGWPLTLPPPVHQALDPSILCLPPEILSVLNVFLYSPYFFLNPPPPFVFIGRAPLITCLFLLFYVLNSLRPFPKISLFNYIGLIPVRSIWGFHLYALCWLCIIFFFFYLSTNIQFNSSDSRFTQQELPACKPILTPKWVRILQYFAKLPIYVYWIFLCTNWYCFFFPFPSLLGAYFMQVISAFMLVTLIFVPIGVASLFASRGVSLGFTMFCASSLVCRENTYCSLLLHHRSWKLLMAMKLPACLQISGIIKLHIFKALKIKHVLELFMWVP